MASNSINNVMGAFGGSNPTTGNNTAKPSSSTGILSNGQVPGQTAGMASAQRARQGALDGLSMVPRGGDNDMLGATAEVFKNAISSGAMFNMNKTSDLHGGLNKYEAIAQNNLYGGLGLSSPSDVGASYNTAQNTNSNLGNTMENISTTSSPSEMNQEAYAGSYNIDDSMYPRY